MNENKLYRKGVAALIVNPKEEFLLVNLKSFAPHFFAIPGGGIEDCETEEEAVYREIKEELGIDKNLLEVVGRSARPLIFTFKTSKLYRDGVEYQGSERRFWGFKFVGKTRDICAETEEVRSHQWVAFEDLKLYLLFEDQLSQTVDKIKEIFYSEY